jgi:Putative redox-active protein (C_GCAxxG_C_C)
LRVLNSAYGHPLEPEEKAVMPLAGGIMQHGYQCGMIWGATLAAGAQAYRLLGQGPQAETRAIFAAQRLVETFRARNKNINCLEITGIDESSSTMQMIIYFLFKGGSIGCFRKTTSYAQEAFSEINTALSKKHIEASSAPTSCSAILAQKMGVSELHTVMAAGFAGGIGLSGGACGALGAAIWIIGMNHLKKGDGKIDFKSQEATEVIDRFLKCTDSEFECWKIVGRRFENVADHAGYLHNGGCSKIIEVLTTK